MKVYLASPFFNDEELKAVEFAERTLRERGFYVFSPREHENRDHEVGTLAWSMAIFEMDRKNIDACDLMVMLYHGAYSDSGTAWECGYAYATHKPVVVVQLGKDSNLMVHEGSHTNITLEQLKDYDFEGLPIHRYSGDMM